MDEENDYTTDLESNFCFPAEFPYEFDSFGSISALSSPVESVLSCTETESDDEEDFLVGLTRRLTQKVAVEPHKKNWIMAGSPESILGGIGSGFLSSSGSSNGEISPPTTPFGLKSDPWDLISVGAGPVSMLKMRIEDKNNSSKQGRGLLRPATSKNPDTIEENGRTGFSSSQSFGQSACQLNQYPLKQKQVPRPLRHSVCRRQQVKESKQDEPQHQQQYQNQRRGRRVMAYEKGRCMLPLGLPQSAWPPLQVKSTQHQHHQQSHNSSGKSTGVFLGGANAKRECAGTGVFLPRTYTKTSDRKKKSARSRVLAPANVVQSLDTKLKDLNMQGHTKPRFNGAFGSDYDAFIENGRLAQQKGDVGAENVLSHEKCVPQEWMY
ncbi:uncharacterized protein LOC110624456 [Manihot esculenta]|uniref:Uncharacterized protein n=2 Tax=Manihot esculenta TaxID=3983 RepID=A0ACB7GYY6_MANES|nr:uncharacterized protein LOC110624456 [Manihot esculenta]KAG8644990.1 hypothetical protein MANES_10G020700v8 [Manihot esculenta]OAY38510.1 hypothetical protein MANES_10G020700v8 [Manihot esculenta]